MSAKIPDGWEKCKVFIGGAGKEVKCVKCGYITSVLQFSNTCSGCGEPWKVVSGNYLMRQPTSPQGQGEKP